MANLHKPSNVDQRGYDASRNLQVMSLNQRTTFYLVAGAGLDVFTDDENVAVASAGASDSKQAHKEGSLSDWEKDQVIRVIGLTAKSPGTTLLRATQDGSDWIAPLSVRVIGDSTCRQVGKAKAQVTPELRRELMDMSLRDAVIRVAEDQMCSAIAQTSGFGVYNMADDLNWCGGFAYWCWDQACAIRGEANPFGTSNKVLWSPERAIDWGIRDTSPVEVLRYAGSSPMDGTGKQAYHDVGWNGCELRRADVVLVRSEKASGWRHVSLIHRISGRQLETIDGNQYKPKIKLVQRSLDSKISNGAYEYAFLAVMRA